MASHRRLAWALTIVAATGAAGMTAMAGAAGGNEQAAQAVTVRQVAAVKAVAFNTKSLRAPRGQVRLVMTNRTALPHNIALRGGKLGSKRVVGRIVGKGKTSTISVKLAPGAYTFYCSVDGHERAGMKGVLRVSR